MLLKNSIRRSNSFLHLCVIVVIKINMLRIIQFNLNYAWQSAKEIKHNLEKEKPEGKKKRKQEEVLKIVLANKSFWKTTHSEQSVSAEMLKRLKHLQISKRRKKLRVKRRLRDLKKRLKNEESNIRKLEENKKNILTVTM